MNISPTSPALQGHLQALLWCPPCVHQAGHAHLVPHQLQTVPMWCRQPPNLCSLSHFEAGDTDGNQLHFLALCFLGEERLAELQQGVGPVLSRAGIRSFVVCARVHRCMCRGIHRSKEEMLKGEGRFVGSLGWRLVEGQVFEISEAACACLPAALCFGAN